MKNKMAIEINVLMASMAINAMDVNEGPNSLQVCTEDWVDLEEGMNEGSDDEKIETFVNRFGKLVLRSGPADDAPLRGKDIGQVLDSDRYDQVKMTLEKIQGNQETWEQLGVKLLADESDRYSSFDLGFNPVYRTPK